MTANRPTALMA